MRARSNWSDTETDEVEGVKTPVDIESSANEGTHQAMLAAVDGLSDDHYGIVRDGPFTPPSPFGDQEAAEEDQTTVPETPKNSTGPIGTHNQLPECTNTKEVVPH